MASDQNPILIFPEKSSNDTARTRRQGFGQQPEKYSRQHQEQVFGPRFDRLRNTLTRIEAGETPADDGDLLLPDRVLVFETKGRVDKFWRAIGRIEGLEPLAEWIKPTRSRERGDERTLYLTLPDRSALAELERLWGRFKAEERAPRNFAGLWQAFELLEDLRRWGLKDRIQPDAEAYFKEQLDLIAEGQAPDGIGVEIELWPYGKSNDMGQALEEVGTLVRRTNGAELISTCRIDDARVGILLAVLPAELVRTLLESDRVGMIPREDLRALADATAIQAFGPRGQTATDPAPVHPATAPRPPDPASFPDPTGAQPRVAVMDTPPVGHHPWVDRWLTVSDRFGLEPAVDVALRHHGTAMVSLALHGTLEEPKTLADPVLALPVLAASQDGASRTQTHLPDGLILADVLRVAIQHLFEDDGHGGPIAPGTRIVSLSIGDSSRPFAGRISSAARVLDWLAFKYDLLILVSAGNYDPIRLPIGQMDFEKLDDAGRRKAVLDHFRQLMIDENAHPPSILSPAEGANVLTVGALDTDPTEDAPHPSPTTQHRFKRDPAFHGPYSRLGPGMQGQIKPDVLFPGGSPVYTMNGGTSCTNLRLVPGGRFGMLEAAPVEGIGEPLTRSVGTSGATATAANAAGRIASMLSELDTPRQVPLDYHGILTKALMVHGCQETDWFHGAAEFHLGTNANALRDYEDLTRFFGYGLPDVKRVLACTDTRATVLGFGELPPDQDAAMEFRFPIPGDLSGQTVPRRIAVTLAWFAPCDAQRVEYKRARLDLEVKPTSNRLTKDRRGSTRGNGRHLDGRGTVIHQVFEGETAAQIPDDHDLPIKVQRAKVSTLAATTRIRFGLAVTLDVGLQTGVDLPIYQRVAERLGIRQPIRPRASG